MLAMAAAPGCMQEERNRQEMMHQRIVTLNRADVMVMTGDLPEAHQTLGEIKYSEPFSGAAIETDHINAKLRTLAIDQYQDRVDAIIHVATGASSDGRDFVVSG